MDVVIALQNELTRRVSKNPAYSVRAFAKSLDVDQSQLSKILTGKQQPSRLMQANISKRLCLETTPTPVDHTTISSRDYQQLQNDQLQVISNWYHLALLELFKVKGFVSSAKVISEQLKISSLAATIALERLTRLGFLRRKQNGLFEVIQENNSWSHFENSTAARAHLQKSLLDKAINALETTPFSERENASLTFAINRRHLPKLKQHIDDFLNKMDVESDNGSDKNAVYQLLVALYPLTEKSREI